jgi:hypothetical protein
MKNTVKNRQIIDFGVFFLFFFLSLFFAIGFAEGVPWLSTGGRHPPFL